MNATPLLPLTSSPRERLLRIITGIALVVAGAFWLPGIWRVVSLSLSIVLLVTGATGFCPLWLLVRTRSAHMKSPSRRAVLWTALGGLAILVLASATSAYVARKMFVADLVALNESYKYALYLTGQKDATAPASATELTENVTTFTQRYGPPRPAFLLADTQLSSDLVSLTTISNTALGEAFAPTPALEDAHRTLENARPILQSIFDRYEVSPLAVALVTFHDAMEAVLTPALASDSAGVLSAWGDADARLRAVEALANDGEIQAIRAALTRVRDAAEAGKSADLPSLGNTMKSSYVRVYLVRG